MASPQSMDMDQPSAQSRGKLMRRNSLKRAATHVQKHKKKYAAGGAGAVVIAIVVVLAVVLTAGAVAYAVHKYNKATQTQKTQAKKAESKVVNIGEKSVIPPKSDDTTTRRMMLASVAEQFFAMRGRYMASKTIDVSSFPAGSDYEVTESSTRVMDNTAEALTTPNIILCMLGQTKAEQFFNQGYYRAQTNQKDCEKKSGAGDSRNNAPSPVSWIIKATAPDAAATTGNYKVIAHLTIKQLGSIDFEVTVPKEKIEFTNNPDGSEDTRVTKFTLKFKLVKAFQQGNDLRGFIDFSTTNEQSTLKFLMHQSMTHPMSGQTVTYNQGATVTFNEKTGSGHAITSVPSYSGPQAKEEKLGFSANLVKVSGSNGDVCLDRDKFANVGERYALFDDQGKKVPVVTHIDIKKTVNGEVVRGSLNTHGMWLYSDWNQETGQEAIPKEQLAAIKAAHFSDGDKVEIEMWDDDATSAKQYTIRSTGGYMEKSTTVTKPLADIDGAEIKMWESQRCNSGDPNDWRTGHREFIIVYSKTAGKFHKIKHGETWQGCSTSGGKGDSWNPPKMAKYPANTVYTPPTDYSARGWCQDLESEVELPKNVDATDAAVKIRVNGRIWRGRSSGTLALICVSDRCLNATKLQAGASVYESYVKRAGTQSYGQRKKSEAILYTFNQATGKLYDAYGVQVSSNTDNWFSMKLVESNAQTFKQMGCDDGASECRTWQVATTYEWRTGSNQNSVSLVSDGDGTEVAPMAEKILTTVLPPVHGRTLSGKTYGGKVLKFRFSQHWIEGLPKMCFNMQTRNITMPYEMGTYGGVQSTTCMMTTGPDTDWSSAPREVHDLLLPRGITATEVNIATGKETMYVLKATNINQIVPAAKDHNVCDTVQMPPITAQIPDISEFGTLTLPPMPSEVGLPLKAVNGVVQPKYRKQAAPAPAPVGGGRL